MLTMSYDKSITMRVKRVCPDYFPALGIQLLAGRGITDQDRAGSPRIAVVNPKLAVRMADVLGLADPIGKHVLTISPEYSKKDVTLVETEIVGVIRSELVGSPGEEADAVVHTPLAQSPAREVRLIIRADRDPVDLLPAIRQAVRQADTNMALGNVSTLQQVQARSLSSVSEPAWLIGAFSAVAALMAALGLYGVLSHAVAQQARK